MKTSDSEALKQVIEDVIDPLIKAMVDYPDDVVLDLLVSTNKTLYMKIIANKADVGKIIGKSGRNADAIRTIVNAIAAGHQHRSIVEVVNPRDQQS